MDTFTCIACGTQNHIKRSTKNKFCNNACQADFRWKQITVPRIERGECTHNSAGPLKRYLVGKHGETCVLCGQGNTWNGQALCLQVDHIDGNSDNNLPSNLRLICPNCHTQTPTYGAKGSGSKGRKDTKRCVSRRK